MRPSLGAPRAPRSQSAAPGSSRVGRQRPCCSDACGVRFHGVLVPKAWLRPEIVPGGPVNSNDTADDHGDAPLHRRQPASAGPGGIRVFAIDMEQCPQCGSTLKIIAAIADPTVMAKILARLGLSIRAPPRSPARSFDVLQTA